ncbi:MAG: acyl-protein synthetase, partial [Myxococcota bacterium]|nr:acyl-protein synthetase [Myxococcota bacterium]
LDAMAERGLSRELPASTRVMETGGFKGRARERSRETLYAEIEAGLGIPASRIVNQYGMTELGSQFYDSVLVDPAGPRRKLGPPWTRVRLVDPDDGSPVGPGEVGVIRIHDLANTGSLAAIQTADLGRAVADGFEVLGRAEGAEERGCSIALDEMLGGAG